MHKSLVLALAVLPVCAAAVFAGGKPEAAPPPGANGPAGRESILIWEPELAGFPEAGGYSGLPGYIQEILNGNFVDYSGMRVVSSGDVPDYFLAVRLERHSATRYSLSLNVQKGEGENIDVIASSTQYVYSLNDLKFGAPLNLATKEILPKLGVKLTSEAGKALSKPLDTKYAEAEAALARASAAPTASFKREQNANIAEDLGVSLAKAGLQLSGSSGERFKLPEFSAPEFVAVTFTPPAIRAFSASATGSALRADLARYRESQAANKLAIEEQQQYLIRQREDILDQWRNFQDGIELRRQSLREEEQKLLNARAELEARLQEGEADYEASPPFRILYDPDPKVTADLERGTANLRYQIAAEPTSLKALKARIDNLEELNKSFANVNTAFEDVNTAMAGRFAQVGAAMDKVKEAMARANAAGEALGQGYKVVPVSTTSADWTIPPGNAVYGAKLKTAWNVDYPRTFKLTVCLVNVSGEDEALVIERASLSLTNDISWNGLFQPESVFAWGSFNNVKIEKLPQEGFLTIWIEDVNGVDTETAAVEGYIEIIPDGARTAAVGKRISARESWRGFWSDPTRFNSAGLAAGTTGVKGDVTPAFFVSPKLTVSPFPYLFFEAGSDFGLLHGERDVSIAGYFSMAPYLHLNVFVTGDEGGKNVFGTRNKYGVYAGVGGGVSFSQYTYPSESGVDPVVVFTPVFDGNLGLLALFGHSVIDLRCTLKTNFTGLTSRITLGYAYRFGYRAPRYGGKPADLTGRSRDKDGNLIRRR